MQKETNFFFITTLNVANLNTFCVFKSTHYEMFKNKHVFKSAT